MSAAQVLHQHLVKALPVDQILTTAKKVCNVASRWAQWVASRAVRCAHRFRQWVIEGVYTYAFRPLINLAIRDVKLAAEQSL